MTAYERPDEDQEEISQQEEAQREAYKEKILRTYLTPDARSRLTNVSLVKAELANAIENLIISLVSQGKLDRRIDEGELKKLLSRMQKSSSRDFKIRRL